MELRDALSQIAEIRQQMARGQLFRGYRAATTAFSGLAALLTGLLQETLFRSRTFQPKLFVLLWTAAAALCLLVVAIEMVIRTCRHSSKVQQQLTLLAVEQFMPSILAGGLLTWAFFDFLPSLLWMLPALWMILFSLGMFASARLLPRSLFIVAAFYLLAGILTLVLTSGTSTLGESLRFSPWLMATVFGVGQSMTAAILYFKLERSHAR